MGQAPIRMVALDLWTADPDADARETRGEIGMLGAVGFPPPPLAVIPGKPFLNGPGGIGGPFPHYPFGDSNLLAVRIILNFLAPQPDRGEAGGVEHEVRLARLDLEGVLVG